MLSDAILEKLLHNDPATLLWAWTVTAIVIGLLAGPARTLLLLLLSRTKRAQAERRRDLNAELQRKYEETCTELVEERRARKDAEQSRDRALGLLREKVLHVGDWTHRARKELAEHDRRAG